jgi:hypothetical protein
MLVLTTGKVTNAPLNHSRRRDERIFWVLPAGCFMGVCAGDLLFVLKKRVLFRISNNNRVCRTIEYVEMKRGRRGYVKKVKRKEKQFF